MAMSEALVRRWVELTTPNTGKQEVGGVPLENKAGLSQLIVLVVKQLT